MNQETQKPAETFDSTYAHDRWQGPSFAASWISPPTPQRSVGEDAGTPSRSDDHG